jgi:hypothetical protein
MIYRASRFLLSLIAIHICVHLPNAAAEPAPDLIAHLSIPIRWCAVQGSPIVEARSRVSDGTTDENLRARHTRATTFVWMPQSGISFRSALTPKTRSRIGFPIIQDPEPPKPDGSGGPGLEGDILAPSYDHRKRKELNMAVGICEKAWEQLEDQLETNFEGIIGINIRRFVQPDGSPAGLLGVGTSLHTVPYGTDKCEIPPPPQDFQPLMSNDGWVVVVDNRFTRQTDPYDSVLAHELGHVLFLGHGNGLDDPAGNPPRKNKRFDGYCDRHENVNAAPFTLMKPQNPVPNLLTDLQRTNARAAARVTVGGVSLQTDDSQRGFIISDDEVDQVGDVKDPSVDLRSLGIHYNTIKGVTIISYRLVGQLPEYPFHRFLVFADLDANPNTGGSPSTIGYPTRFQGAEIVTEVLVKRYVGEDQRRVTTSVWFYRSGKFVKSPAASRIKAEVMPAVLGHSGKVAYDVITLQIPHGLVVPRPVKVRFQAMTERMGGELDRLPDKGEQGRLIRLTKPQYPSCRVSPHTIKAGDPLKLKATGFIPNRTVNIFIDHERIGSTELNHNGNVTVQIPTPSNAKDGRHLLVVAIAKKALTAQCSLTITGGTDGKKPSLEPRK